jgi:polyisoprenoid-binding protein YceI
MNTTTQIRTSLPTGTWRLDPVHSSIGFEIEYMAGTFRGQFRDVKATLVVARDGGAHLEGAAKVASVDVKDENLAGHLASPEFFDAARHPELRFVSTEIEGGEELTVRGEITIKGVTQPVELTGTATSPLTDAYERERFGLTLSTKLDRTAFGVNWNMPLPSGDSALSDEVTLVAELYFLGEA